MALERALYNLLGYLEMVRPWWSMPPDNQNHCRGFLISVCKILYYIEKYPLWKSDSSIVTGFF